MNGTLLLIELAGHVGLLLWGTHMVGTGVQRGFGTILRRWLGRNLGSRFRAFLTGIGVTALLQSSTATGLLATSFTATGVMALAPALAVMLGANVGTALLTQVLSFNVALVGPPLVLVGVLVFRWAAGGRAKNIGRVGIGLGLMLMALSGLVHTLGPIENTPLLRPVDGLARQRPDPRDAGRRGTHLGLSLEHRHRAARGVVRGHTRGRTHGRTRARARRQPGWCPARAHQCLHSGRTAPAARQPPGARRRRIARIAVPA